jgi:transposase
VLLELTVAEQRFNAVMEVLRDGLTVIEVAGRYGVSRQTVHGWLGRYRTGGLEALADRSHRPRRCPHQMPATVEAHLCELRRHHPGWGQRRLAHELVRVGVDPAPGLTSIYRALVRNGLIQPRLIQPRPRRRAKASYRRWERAQPMELWQLDIMGGIWLTDGRELKAVTGIDDHSRFCVAAGLVERANAPSVCQVFTQALDRYGSPDELLTDNGKVSPARLGPGHRQPVDAPVVADRQPRACPTRDAVAATRPAEHQLIPAAAVLLSDGAGRLVDLFELATWEELLALLDENGPAELLRQVRAAEATDPRAGSGPGPSAATTPPPSTWFALLTAEPGTSGKQLSRREPQSPTTPRVEGSGRTVLACPTPSRKRSTNQPGTRADHRPAVLIDGRLRWLHRLPLAA